MPEASSSDSRACAQKGDSIKYIYLNPPSTHKPRFDWHSIRDYARNGDSSISIALHVAHISCRACFPRWPSRTRNGQRPAPPGPAIAARRLALCGRFPPRPGERLALCPRFLPAFKSRGRNRPQRASCWRKSAAEGDLYPRFLPRTRPLRPIPATKIRSWQESGAEGEALSGAWRKSGAEGGFTQGVRQEESRAEGGFPQGARRKSGAKGPQCDASPRKPACYTVSGRCFS